MCRRRECLTVTEDLGSALNSTVPHSARIWNYLLGGKDNFAVDRAVGDQITASLPHFVEHARLSRKYLARAAHQHSRGGDRLSGRRSAGAGEDPRGDTPYARPQR